MNYIRIWQVGLVNLAKKDAQRQSGKRKREPDRYRLSISRSIEASGVA